ncbi:MAG: hypothetical protein S4CHLAM20_14470 [Chlamydiia bacterium]|nr:hypothetical protein [Chlamydiia bacterium]
MLISSYSDPVDQRNLDALKDQKRQLNKEMPTWKVALLFLSVIGIVFYAINLHSKIQIDKEIQKFEKQKPDSIELKSYSYRNTLGTKEDYLEKLDQTDDILEVPIHLQTYVPQIEILLSLVNYEGTPHEVLQSINQGIFELKRLDREFQRSKADAPQSFQKLYEEKSRLASQHLLNQVLIWNLKGIGAI